MDASTIVIAIVGALGGALIVAPVLRFLFALLTEWIDDKAYTAYQTKKAAHELERANGKSLYSDLGHYDCFYCKD